MPIRPLLWSVILTSLFASNTAISNGGHDPALLAPLDRSALRQELDASEGSAVLVNLWATWCAPCLREIPDLLALEAELPAGDFRPLAIGIDDPYSADWVTEFKARHFPALASFINAELDMDALVSTIDPV